MIDLLGGAVGTALWAGQMARARKLLSPPPMLTHCAKASEYRIDTVVYNDKMKMDIWRAEHVTGDAPVLLFVPGGGWLIGRRPIQGYALMSSLVEQGWICVTIDYRTAPIHRWPQCFLDVQSSLNWLRANIESYGGDHTFVAVAGASAGGHMASLAGLAWDYPHGDFDMTEKPDAVVSLYGAYDWEFRDSLYHTGFGQLLERVIVGKCQADHPDLFSDASPMAHVRQDAPPFLIVHGDKDWLTPVGGARRFHKKLAATSGQIVDYHEISGVGHAFDLTRSKATASAVGHITRFLNFQREWRDLKAAS